MRDLFHIPHRTPSAPHTARMNASNTKPEVVHDHSFWEMVILLSGTSTEYIRDARWEVERGDVILLRPGDFHSFRIHTPETYEHRDIYLPCGELREICRALDDTLYETLANLPMPLRCRLEPPFLDSLNTQLNAYENLYYLADRPQHLMTFRSIVAYLIGLLIQNQHAEDGRPAWLIRFLSEIGKPENLSLRLSELVRFSGFSHSRLCVLFRQYMGKSLVEYLVEQKLEYSLWLLNASDLSVLEISARLGYDSMSHFIHIFKKRYGITPEKYRRRNRPASSA